MPNTNYGTCSQVRNVQSDQAIAIADLSDL
jgi:hypothetical protein